LDNWLISQNFIFIFKIICCFNFIYFIIIIWIDLRHINLILLFLIIPQKIIEFRYFFHNIILFLIFRLNYFSWKWIFFNHYICFWLITTDYIRWLLLSFIIKFYIIKIKNLRFLILWNRLSYTYIFIILFVNFINLSLLII